jgi:hypothetical protein
VVYIIVFMLEQLSSNPDAFDPYSFNAPPPADDTRVQPQVLSHLGAFEVSPLVDFPLPGDGVALQPFDVTSTRIAGGAKEDAYMLATAEGNTCPTNECAGDTTPKECPEQHSKVDNCK